MDACPCEALADKSLVTVRPIQYDACRLVPDAEALPETRNLRPLQPHMNEPWWLICHPDSVADGSMPSKGGSSLMAMGDENHKS
eukprot:8918652-Alexandrium_andersonii.AAC.1